MIWPFTKQKADAADSARELASEAIHSQIKTIHDLVEEIKDENRCDNSHAHLGGDRQ